MRTVPKIAAVAIASIGAVIAPATSTPTSYRDGGAAGSGFFRLDSPGKAPATHAGRSVPPPEYPPNISWPSNSTTDSNRMLVATFTAVRLTQASAMRRVTLPSASD